MSLKLFLILHGTASQKKTKISVNDEDLSKTLLTFLNEKNFPIASSCSGVGSCKKCVVCSDQLSCQITVHDFLKLEKNIEVSYL